MNQIIDWQSCVQLANNNEDLARDLLSMLVQDFPKTLAELEHAKLNTDYEQIQYISHRLHGAACYCGVPKLKEAAKELELYLKNTPSPDTKTCHQLINQLLNAIQDILNAYTQLTS